MYSTPTTYETVITLLPGNTTPQPKEINSKKGKLFFNLQTELHDFTHGLQLGGGVAAFDRRGAWSVFIGRLGVVAGSIGAFRDQLPANTDKVGRISLQ